MSSRKRQQTTFLIVFLIVPTVGFTVGKLLALPDCGVVAVVFVSALVVILSFYRALPVRTRQEKPDWVIEAKLGSALSSDHLKSKGFSLIKRSLVNGRKHYWYFYEDRSHNGTWRQEIEIVEESLCAYSLKFSANDTLFGDQDCFLGIGHFVKPPRAK